jgi:uncharacterized membrane protein YagU involved in acid resistance
MSNMSLGMRSTFDLPRMIEAIVQGFLSGLLATGPMTAAMKLMHQRLPRHERHPLPPRKITMEMARRAEVEQHMSRTHRTAATWASHFGYGSVVGALYGALCRKGIGPGFGSGTLYGLAVWAVSYLGILPALGILKPATRHPPRRTALMIVAHVVWGIVLGGLMRRLQREEQP